MEAEAAILAITLSSLFCFFIGWQVSRMLIKGRIIEIVRDEVWRRIQDLEYQNSKLEGIVSTLTAARNDAIKKAKLLEDERDEALLMLSKHITTKKK